MRLNFASWEFHILRVLTIRRWDDFLHNKTFNSVKDYIFYGKLYTFFVDVSNTISQLERMRLKWLLFSYFPLLLQALHQHFHQETDLLCLCINPQSGTGSWPWRIPNWSSFSDHWSRYQFVRSDAPCSCLWNASFFWKIVKYDIHENIMKKSIL